MVGLPLPAKPRQTLPVPSRPRVSLPLPTPGRVSLPLAYLPKPRFHTYYTAAGSLFGGTATIARAADDGVGSVAVVTQVRLVGGSGANGTLGRVTVVKFPAPTSGAGTLAASARVTSGAPASGAGTLTGSAVSRGTARPSGVGSLSTSTYLGGGFAGFTGAGSMLAQIRAQVSAAFGAAGTFGASYVVGTAVNARFTAEGTVDDLMSITASSFFSGEGSAVLSTNGRFYVPSPLSGAGTFSAAPRPSLKLSGTAVGGMAASSYPGAQVTAVLSAAGTFSLVSRPQLGMSQNTGAGSLTAGAYEIEMTVSGFSAVGTVSAAQQAVTTAPDSAVGSASMASAAVMAAPDSGEGSVMLTAQVRLSPAFSAEGSAAVVSLLAGDADGGTAASNVGGAFDYDGGTASSNAGGTNLNGGTASG